MLSLQGLVTAVVSLPIFLFLLAFILAYCYRAWLKLTMGEPEKYAVWKDVTERVALVTGVATTGLGFETARQLAVSGCKEVLITARDEKRGRMALEGLRCAVPGRKKSFHLLLLDLASKGTIEAFVKELRTKTEKLHILVHNAGMICPDYRTGEGGNEMQMWTNHLGPFYLTSLLWPMLSKQASARIVIVSSVGAAGGKLGTKREVTVDNLNYTSMRPGGSQPYSQLGVYSESKLANEFFCYALAQRLDQCSEHNQTSAVLVHPGAVMASELNRESNGLWGLVPKTIAPILSHPQADMARAARFVVHWIRP